MIVIYPGDEVLLAVPPMTTEKGQELADRLTARYPGVQVTTFTGSSVAQVVFVYRQVAKP